MDAGMAVGASDVGGGVGHAFLYTGGMGMKDLGTLGGSQSIAVGVNNMGYVVGEADCIEQGNVSAHAFLYRDGRMIDLNAVTDRVVGWVLQRAAAINDSNQIAGFGRAPDGNMRAFLLTPVEEAGG